MRAGFLAVGAILVVAGLTACKREPTFEERYATAENAIRQKAGELDKDIANRAAEARETPAATGRPTQGAIQ